MKTLLALIVAIAATGCVTHRSLSSTELTPRTALRVRFTEPRALTFRAGEATVMALDDVVELHGMMVLTSGDSVRVATKNARSRLGDLHRFGLGTTTTFALADGRIEQVNEHAGATVVVILAAFLGVLLVLAVANHEEPPPPPPPEPKPKS